MKNLDSEIEALAITLSRIGLWVPATAKNETSKTCYVSETFEKDASELNKLLHADNAQYSNAQYYNNKSGTLRSLLKDRYCDISENPLWTGLLL